MSDAGMILPPGYSLDESGDLVTLLAPNGKAVAVFGEMADLREIEAAAYVDERNVYEAWGRYRAALDAKAEGKA